MLRAKSGLLTALLGAGLLVGCAASGNEPQASTQPVAQAVTCSKCQVTWVRVPTQRGKITTFTSRKSMQCPDCKNAVENFFATGKLEHTCKTCGDSMELRESH